MSDGIRQTAYSIRSDVFLAVCGKHVVILNLRKNTYSAIPLALAYALAPRISMWPVSSTIVDSTVTNNIEPTLAALIESGVLTTEVGSGTARAPIDQVASTCGALAIPRRPVTVIDLGRFVSAYIRARFMLKYVPVSRIVQRVRARRAKCSVTPAEIGVGARRHSVQELVATFWRLRPLLFSAKDTALVESLAFVEFLAKYGMYPRWVFAVHMDPFVKRFWVQQDNTILAHSIEYAQSFEPIMAA